MNQNNIVITTSGLVVPFFTLERVLFYVVLACRSECECESNCSLTDVPVRLITALGLTTRSNPISN